MRRVFVLLFFLLICSRTLSASILLRPSAILKKPLEVTLETSALDYRTNHFWNKNGQIFPSFNRFRKEEYECYLELGLTSCDTLTAQTDYAIVYESINGKCIGVEDIEVGWKHLIYQQENLFVATQLIGFLPPGSHKSTLRYGRKGIEADLLLTKWFPNETYCIYGDLQAGYRYYEGFPSDQIRAIGQIGIDFSPFQLIIAGKLTYGIFNGRKELHQNIILLNPNYRLFKIEIQGLYHITPWLALAAGYAQHIWGRNVGNGGEFFGGLRFEF